MKIPTSALKGIQSTVMAMLPYESHFKPDSDEAKTLIAISVILQHNIDDFKELSGLTYFIARKIDECRELQIKFRKTYMSISAILDEYIETTIDEYEDK